MSSPETKPQRTYDVRTIERNIKKGNVTRKDYEKYVKSLPDTTEKVAPPEEDRADDVENSDDNDENDEDDEPGEATP